MKSGDFGKLKNMELKPPYTLYILYINYTYLPYRQTEIHKNKKFKLYIHTIIGV